jgi:hypothetical protein
MIESKWFYLIAFIIFDILFLSKYLKYTEETELDSVMQPVQLIMMFIGLLSCTITNFHFLSILFFVAMILISLLMNHSFLEASSTAILYTLWQVLFTISIVIVLIYFVLYYSSLKDRKNNANKVK